MRIGEQYGYLTVVGTKPSPRNGVAARATCRCVCGQVKDIPIHNLKKKIKSCGCRRLEGLQRPRPIGNYFRLPPGEASFNNLFYQYRASAKKRGLEFSLSRDEFRALTSSSCTYCGTPPAHESAAQVGYNGKYIYNGIDRVDNGTGYVANNVVSCCWVCNDAKGSRSVTEFTGHCLRVASLLGTSAP